MIIADEFRFDEIFFNSILDVCCKYEFMDELKEFYNLMGEKNINSGYITLSILIKAYGNMGDLETASKYFNTLIKNNMKISDITYGCMLNSCAKKGKMNIAMKVYNSLLESELNMNSIVFTTLIKGFIKAKAYN